jgi:hypothetical protein
MRDRPTFIRPFVKLEVKTRPAAEERVFLAHLLRHNFPKDLVQCLQLAGLSGGYENTSRPSCSVQYMTKVASPKYCTRMDKMLFRQLDICIVFFERGHAVSYWLRHYATGHKVARSRPDGVNDFYQFVYPSNRPRH